MRFLGKNLDFLEKLKFTENFWFPVFIIVWICCYTNNNLLVFYIVY